MSKLKQFISDINAQLIDDAKRISFQFNFCYIVFSVVSLIMTVVNSATGFSAFKWATLVFGVLNLVNLVLGIQKSIATIIARILFTIEIIVLFTYFIVNGEPEGFSVLWTILLPTCGILLYGRKWGSIISGIVFIEIIFFFWIPFGKTILMWDYQEQFMVRFPMLYFACYIVGFLLEYVRLNTMVELKKARDKYIQLSLKCSMTGLFNAAAYNREVARLEKRMAEGFSDFAIISMDLNGLKYINDTKGHLFGDELFAQVGRVLPPIFKDSLLYHIGGDEFAIIVLGSDFSNLSNIVDDLKSKITFYPFMYDGEMLVLSLAFGYAIYENGETFDDTFKRADAMMYENKEAIKAEFPIFER